MKWLGIFGLAALTLLFADGLHGPFLLDDLPNLDGARASTGTLGEMIYAAFHNDSGLLHRPISNLSFVLNYHWLGPESFGYKLINLIIHWLNACLVWRLVVRILKLLYPQNYAAASEITALLIAALWAIHPLQVSSVLYVVQRMAELSAFFVLLALLLYLRFVQSPLAHTIRRTIQHVFIVGAVLIFGMLSKENTALFSYFLLSIYLSAPAAVRAAFSRDRASKISFALFGWMPVLLTCVVVVLAWQWVTSSFASREFSLSDRIFTEPFVLCRYLGNMLYPDIRNMGLYVDDMPLHHSNEPLAWLLLGVTLTLPIAAIALRKHFPALTFAILWFFSAHLLESTILPLEIAFEHRNYLALLGPMFAVGYYITKLLSAIPIKVARYAAVIPLAVLGAGTLVRAHQWSDGKTFLVHEVENHPLSPRAQNAAVELDIESGDLEKAAERVKNVQRLKPGLFWPLSLDFNLACGNSSHVVQWQRMERQIEEKPGDMSIIGMLQYDAQGYLHHNCGGVDPEAFDLFLLHVVQIYQSKQMPVTVEQIFVLRSYVAKALNQTERVREVLNAGSLANPQGIIALSDLAYFELNNSNVELAESAINRLESRVNSWWPTHRFEVDELHKYLDQEKRR